MILIEAPAGLYKIPSSLRHHSECLLYKFSDEFILRIGDGAAFSVNDNVSFKWNLGTVTIGPIGNYKVEKYG